MVAADVAADKLELATRRTWNAKTIAHENATANKEAQDAKVNTATSNDTTADTILAAATKALTDATSHESDETALVTSTLATLNAAMGVYKGRANSSTTAKDTGKTAGSYTAGSKAKLAATALTNLETAVGKCTPTGGAAWDGGQCPSNATSLTGLVRFALRKKLGVDNVTTSKATRETYLDAYCRAAQTLGAADADIKSGKEYYGRANPGVRNDFLFTATVGANGNAARKDDTTYRSTWAFETLGAV